MAFRLRTLALVAACAVAVAACGSGYHYATRSRPTLVYRTGSGLAQVEAASTYFKVPPRWKLLDEEAFLQASGAIAGATPEQAFLARKKTRFQPFDAAPRPSVAHVLDTESTHPTGFSQVYVLDDDERDGVSLRDLRNLLIRVDPNPETGASNAEVLVRDDEIVRPGGFHGIRVVFNVKADDGTLLTVDKTTLVDKNSRVVYLFVVGCGATCFRQHHEAIAEVVDSWTVRDK